MADNQWPLTLPQGVERPQYREKLPDIMIRTPMDAGPDKVRLASTTGNRGLTVSLIFTNAEYEIFKEFFRGSILGGSLPFDFVHPRTGETIEVSLTEEPKAVCPGGLYWMVTMSLETMDPVPTDPSAPQFLMEGLGFGDVSDFLMGGLG